jgi:hypothetical protein
MSIDGGKSADISSAATAGRRCAIAQAPAGTGRGTAALRQSAETLLLNREGWVVRRAASEIEPS